ncbi:hypothetical protein SEA_BOMBITAS_68 [Mycobacterium phage Bombitas]|nr:hypothetical protein SEA_HALLEY_80 [Mycobacterium phage Halley]WNM72629.1 hypothetical protein SEA_BOMBITAS_68 [Mycobacterium phage Bombitas]
MMGHQPYYQDDQWPDDCYEVRSRWVSGWSEA